MRGIAIPLLTVAAPLLAELPSARGGTAPTPASSEARPPALLAARLPASRSGYQVHNGRAARDAATT